jgi:hypothetical protein
MLSGTAVQFVAETGEIEVPPDDTLFHHRSIPGQLVAGWSGRWILNITSTDVAILYRHPYAHSVLDLAAKPSKQSWAHRILELSFLSTNYRGVLLDDHLGLVILLETVPGEDVYGRRQIRVLSYT